MTKYLFLFFIASIAACSSDPDVLPEEEEDIIEIVYSEAEPCTSANDDCLQTITLTSEEGRKILCPVQWLLSLPESRR